MLTKAISFLAVLALPTLAAAQGPIYKDPRQPIGKRVDDLLGRMTLQEKINQLQHIHGDQVDTHGRFDFRKLLNRTKGNSFGCMENVAFTAQQYLDEIYAVQKEMTTHTRLGVPVIPVAEGLHGLVHDGCTIYPQAIAIASTFDPSLVYRMAQNIASDMKAVGVRQVLSPDLDLARELRWGRVEETYGEDPFLVAQMGVQYARAIRENGLICTPKHFIAHGSPDNGLNLASVAGGRRELLGLYMQPFEKVIREHPLSIMNCYSAYDGEPVAGSSYFLTDLLRNTLKFDGYVYSDWSSIEMLYSFHHTAAGPADAARQAIMAGVDLEAYSDCFDHLKELVSSGKLDVHYIDRAVRRVLYTKFASGLFDAPLPDTVGLSSKIHAPGSVMLARQMADESIVLLKNDRHLLPLSTASVHTLAVIGPSADQVEFGDYSWTRSNKDGVTPLAGLTRLLGPSVQLRYARGCDFVSHDSTGFAEAVSAAGASDAAVVFVGSQSASLARDYTNTTSGEGYDLSDLDLPGAQQALVEAIQRTGKPVIVVLVTGKPFSIPWIKDHCPAVVMQWYGGEQEGAAIAGMLFGKTNPSGRLPVSIPRSVGTLPVYYNHLPSDRGFYHEPGTPDKPGRDYVFSSPQALWSFGFGLSYTDFDYANLQVSSATVGQKDTIRVMVDVKNTGDVAGKEVIQVYVRQEVSSVETPVQQLKAFGKVSLEPGQTRTVELKIPVSELYLYNKDYKRVVEPGVFELRVGHASDDIRLTKRIVIARG